MGDPPGGGPDPLDVDLHEARRLLRTAAGLIAEAQVLLEAAECRASLAAIAHVQPWLMTARREAYLASRDAR